MYGGIGGAIIKECIHSLNFWIFHGALFKYASRFEDTSRTPAHVRLLLNLLAKQLNWLCTVPFEVVANLNQLSKPSLGFFATACQLFREGGIRAFYRGLTVSLLLAINPAIMNTLITSLLRLVALVRQARGESYEDARHYNAAVVGGVTGLAKAFATALTYPLIRAKVLQQTLLTKSSLVEVLRSTFGSEGVRGLYRGVLAMSYKTILWNSIMMACKHMLQPRRALTPPGSPRTLQRLPLMAREPFPVELLTVEKLDEILGYLKMEPWSGDSRRLDMVEQRLDETKREIREIRHLLEQLVDISVQTWGNRMNGGGACDV